MRAPECISAKISTQTSVDATVMLGGYFQLAAVSGAWNSAHLHVDQLMPDGTTWLASTVLVATANAVVFGYLPPGNYRFTVDTATPTDPIYASLQRVPGE